MTFPDLGPERPGPASSTRTMVEQDRRRETETEVKISGRAFWIAMAVIIAVLAVLVGVLAAVN